jgi:hypothetical protein
VRPIALAAVTMVAIALGLRVIAAYLDNSLSRPLAGAIAVMLVAGRIGVETESASARARRRALRGAALACAAMTVPFVLTVARGARIGVGTIELSALLGSVEAFAVAYRDELWLRGIPLLLATRALVPRVALVPFFVAAAVAAIALEPNARLGGIAMIAGSSLLFSVLWLETRDAWAPVAAHAAWLWSADVLFGGEILELSHKLPATPSASGAVSWCAAIGFAAVAALAWRRIPDSERHT